MNNAIHRLAKTAEKQVKNIIGLMSGTSLDGLDIALCEVRGSGADTEVRLKNFITKEHSSEIKQRLKAITSVPRASMEEVCLLHSWLGNYHGELISDALGEWDVNPSGIDCIASHGQTIYHAPKIQHQQRDMPNATLQIGDGDHIARTTGILTISDFRQKHTAAGGEGAPMVSFVDRALYTDDSEDRILLNIGGIANFTYLPAGNPHQSVTTDTGPGNTLIDAAMQKHFSEAYDKDGKTARQGTVNTGALEALKSDPYFQKTLPKTTGPEVFNLEWVNNQLVASSIDDLLPKDLVATLTRLSAETIADSIKKILSDDQTATIYVSGGGFHNPVLMEWLQELLPNCRVQSFESIGFNPDAKEAVLFAVLANELLSGEGFFMDEVAAGKSKINFGKISFPD